MITAVRSTTAAAAITATAAAVLITAPAAPAALAAAPAISNANVALAAGWQPLRPLIEGTANLVPVVDFGPITFGGGYLARAYYDGYGGLGGFLGIASAVVTPVVNSAIGGVTGSLSTIVTSAVRTAANAVPVTVIGPVTFGQGRLVNDFFDGYREVVGENVRIITGLEGVQADLGAQIAAWTAAQANPAAAGRTARRTAAATAAVATAAARPAAARATKAAPAAARAKR